MDHADIDHTGLTGVGGVALSSATPLVESGAGGAGAGTAASKDDHVHPAAGGGAEFATASADVATDEGTTSASYTDLTTSGPAVTVTIGASGKAKVTVGGYLYSSGTTGAQAMGFAVSGASTVAAADANALMSFVEMIGSRTVLLTGLAAGSTTFTAKYKHVSTSNTSHFFNRDIIVEPVL